MPGEKGRLYNVVVDSDNDGRAPEFFYISDNIADPFSLYHKGMVKAGRVRSQALGV